MSDKLFEKYPLDRMKKLHRNIINTTEDLFELNGLLDFNTGTDLDHLKDLIMHSMGSLCAIARYLSEYTLDTKGSVDNDG